MAADNLVSIRDPYLSEEGATQAKKVADQIKAFSPELVVASPSSSALQTALLAFGSCGRQIFPHKLLRETPKVLVKPRLVGMPQRDDCMGRLKATLQDDENLTKMGGRDLVAWDQLEDGPWWSNTIISTQESCREGLLFREWLLERPESRIALVGHSAKLMNMVKFSSGKPGTHWLKSVVPYYCYLVSESTTGFTKGDLLYGGTSPQTAAIVIPKGVRSKCILLLRNGKTVAQVTNVDKQQKKRCMSGSVASPSKKVPKVSPVTTTAHQPIHCANSYVLVGGIEKKPELNGQVGKIVSFEGGPEKRYTVRLKGNLLSLRENKLTKTKAPAPAVAATSRDEESSESDVVDFKKLPNGKLTSEGCLIPTYSWVKVPAVATLPPGLEVRMPLDGLKCARIPSTWRLQVVAEGQCDAYRCNVGKRTRISEILKGVASAFKWDEPLVRLCANGSPLNFAAKATVGSACLFGMKLTAKTVTS